MILLLPWIIVGSLNTLIARNVSSARLKELGETHHSRIVIADRFGGLTTTFQQQYIDVAEGLKISQYGAVDWAQEDTEYSYNDGPSVQEEQQALPKDDDEDIMCKWERSLCNTMKTLDEIYFFLQDIAAKYKHTAILKVIGESYEGRPIYMLEIHEGYSLNFSTIVVEFGIHAREWASTASALHLINELIREETSIRRHIQWFIIPLLNPDGYKYSTTTNNMWRKNRRPLPSSKCEGVDVNRNFGIGWDSDAPPCREDYPGAGPFSERESKAVKDFITSIVPSTVDAYIAVHTCAQSILYPYGYTITPPESSRLKKLKHVSQLMAQAMTKVRGVKYTAKPAHELGVAGGCSDDYMFEHFHIPLVFTMELGDESYFTAGNYHHCFHPPSPTIMNNLVKECYSGLITIANYLQQVKPRRDPPRRKDTFVKHHRKIHDGVPVSITLHTLPMVITRILVEFIT